MHSSAFIEVEPALAFAVAEREQPAIELRVNFGMFAGREATPAEIEALGKELLGKVSHVSIVSEHHHEIGFDSESAVHQVRIDVPEDALPRWGCNLQELRGRLLEVTERWVHACIADRPEALTNA